MMILLDENQPLPDYEMQNRAHLIGIRCGNQVRLVKSTYVAASGIISNQRFREIVDISLKEMLDDPE